MTRLRRLNDRGLREFRQYLQQVRQGVEFPPNPAILHVDDTSSRVEPSIEIENVPFPSKYAAAEYLTAKLAPLGVASADDAGLWAWLALFYFEQLSPKDAAGKRRPRADYHYIPSLEHGWDREQRHLLAGPHRLFQMHGPLARLLLHPRVHEHGAFVYDLGMRREIITNRGLIEAIDILYWDRAHHRPKRGATSENNRGNLRRLIAVLQQLDFNYDLFGMTAREILDLLPPEFDPWKEAGGQAGREQEEE